MVIDYSCLIYLKYGTGYAWASHVKAMVPFCGTLTVNVDASLGNEGPLKPIGSEKIYLYL